MAGVERWVELIRVLKLAGRTALGIGCIIHDIGKTIVWSLKRTAGYLRQE